MCGIKYKYMYYDISSMRHLALTCCIILQSIINLFQMVTQKLARNEVKNMDQGTWRYGWLNNLIKTPIIF